MTSQSEPSSLHNHDNILLFKKKINENSQLNSTKLNCADENSIHTDGPLLRYMLFSFIISNDPTGLKDILENINGIPHRNLWITYAEIADFERNLIGGILMNGLCAKLLKSFLYCASDCEPYRHETNREEPNMRCSSKKVFLYKFDPHATFENWYLVLKS